jgi:hypothetical protein
MKITLIIEDDGDRPDRRYDFPNVLDWTLDVAPEYALPPITPWDDPDSLVTTEAARIRCAAISCKGVAWPDEHGMTYRFTTDTAAAPT